MTALAIPTVDTDALLDEIADYADLLAASAHSADTPSMDVADAMETIYQERAWVAEWLEQKPAPKKFNPRYREDSRSRFAQWLEWKQSQRQRRAPERRRVYQLMKARDLFSVVNSVHNGNTTEGAIRPLAWLDTNGYAERLPEVWRIAVDLAGRADLVTSVHTKEAVAIFKKNLGTRGVASAIKTSKARRERGIIKSHLFEMIQMAGQSSEARDQLRATLNDIEEMVRTRSWVAGDAR